MAWIGGGATSPLTTKGDLWGYGTADDRVPVGSDGQVLTADSSDAKGVSWQDATGGGGGPLGAWTQDNVAASQTAVALTLTDGVRTTVPIAQAGTITGIAVWSNEARTAGTLTVEVVKNGVGTGLTATLDGTNVDCDTGTGAVAVEGCDEITVEITTDGSWAPTTADVIAVVQLGTDQGGGWADVILPSQGPGGAVDDEFDDATLDAAWTLIEPSALVTVTEANDVASFHHPGGGTSGQWHALVKSLGSPSAPTTIEAAVRLAADRPYDFPHFGLFLSDGATYSAGTQLFGYVHGHAVGQANNTQRLNAVLANYTSYTTIGTVHYNQPLFASLTWVLLRLKWTATNTFAFEFSPDGVSWIVLASGVSATLTPTHGGIAIHTQGQSRVTVGTAEYFRVT